jgi:hypothetical protein
MSCTSASVAAGYTSPSISATLPYPCITITLPSFSFSFSFSLSLALPNFALFLKLALNLNICDLSQAFGITAGAAIPPCGGRTLVLPPDPSLNEQTYAQVAA